MPKIDSKKPLKMFWWRLDHPHRGNFGDEISAVLVNEIFGLPCMWTAPDQCELVGAGSIIETLLRAKGSNRPALWGSGAFLRDGGKEITEDDFDVLALRGELSRKLVKGNHDSIALGDPGLLASALLRSKPKKMYALGILPHFLDAELPEIDMLRSQSGVKVIDATNEPTQVVEEIAECQCVLSSSLHGLIVADSVGIPNAHMMLSNNEHIGGTNKFRDYYSVFSNPSRHIVLDPDPVLRMPVSSIVQRVEESYVVPTDIDDIKEALIKSFPY